MTNQASDMLQAELREDFRRFLQLGVNPILERINMPTDDEATVRLYNTIIEANMISVKHFIEAYVVAVKPRTYPYDSGQLNDVHRLAFMEYKSALLSGLEKTDNG